MGSYVITIYHFNHFESVVIGMITMLFVYVILRFNKIDRKLDAIVSDSVVRNSKLRSKQ